MSDPIPFDPYPCTLGTVTAHEAGSYLITTPDGRVIGIPATGEPSGEAVEADIANPPGALAAAKAAKAAEIDAEARALVAAGATLIGAQYGPANGLTFGITDPDRLNWDQLNAMLEKAAKLGASSGTLVEQVLGAPILAQDGEPVFGLALVNYDHFLLGVGAAYGAAWGIRATRLAALAEAETIEEVEAV